MQSYNPIKWTEVSGPKASGLKAKIRLHGVGQMDAGQRTCFVDVACTAEKLVAKCDFASFIPAAKVVIDVASLEDAKAKLTTVLGQIANQINGQLRNGGELTAISGC